MRKSKTINHYSEYTHYKDFTLCKETDVINEKEYGDSNELRHEFEGNHKVYYRVQSDNRDVTEHYDYLKYLGNDHFIFGEQHIFDGFCPKIKYGVLSLVRDTNGNIIHGREEIIFWWYDKIDKSNMPGILIADEDGLGTYLNIDPKSEYYGKKLLPSVLEETGKFIGEFAKVKVKNTGEEGYLPRDAKPVTNEENIKLLTKQQVECLTDFQENLGQVSLTHEFIDADVIYKEITGHSYTMKEKDK